MVGYQRLQIISTLIVADGERGFSHEATSKVGGAFASLRNSQSFVMSARGFHMLLLLLLAVCMFFFSKQKGRLILGF